MWNQFFWIRPTSYIVSQITMILNHSQNTMYYLKWAKKKGEIDVEVIIISKRTFITHSMISCKYICRTIVLIIIFKESINTLSYVVYNFNIIEIDG